MKENNAYRDCFRYDQRCHEKLSAISKHLQKVGEKNSTSSCIKYAINKAYLLLKLKTSITHKK